MSGCERCDLEISDGTHGTSWACASQDYWNSSLQRLRSKALFGIELVLFLLAADYLIPDPQVLARSHGLVIILGAGALANFLLRLPATGSANSAERRATRALLGAGLAMLVLATGYLSPDPKMLEGTKWLAILLGSSAVINLFRVWWELPQAATKPP
jgi:hypothetical protein